MTWRVRPFGGSRWPLVVVGILSPLYCSLYRVIMRPSAVALCKGLRLEGLFAVREERRKRATPRCVNLLLSVRNRGENNETRLERATGSFFSPPISFIRDYWRQFLSIFGDGLFTLACQMGHGRGGSGEWIQKDML